MEEALRWPGSVTSVAAKDGVNQSESATPSAGAQPVDSRLCHDGIHHFLLPAFFKTITELKARGREFTIVVRTFGHDVADVVAAINAFAEGKHLPQFPAITEMNMKVENVSSTTEQKEEDRVVLIF